MSTNREHVSTAEIAGRLGRNPEIQYTEDKTPFVKLSVATSERFTDQGGAIRERTEWHNAVAWGKTAEDIARDFTKGDSIALSGSLRVNSYEKDGLKNRLTELHVQDARKQMDGPDNQPTNSARLVGVVREEPKTRSLESGGHLTTLSVATRTLGGKDGKREHEDWHSVALWGKTAQAARDIKVGDTIAINGPLRHRAVPGEDGRERKLSVIDGQRFQVLERALERQMARRPSKGLDRGM